MVVLTEVKNMFWGITLDAGKRYTQTVDTSFHISAAALEVGTTFDGPKQRVALMIQHEKVEFLVCTLDNKTHFQQALDLNFTEGEEVSFFLNGSGVVHLTGYLVPEETNEGEYGDYSADMTTSDDEDEDEDDEDSDEEIPILEELPEVMTGKRKRILKEVTPKKKQKVVVAADSDDEEDEDDEDESDDDSEDESFQEMDLDLDSSEDDDDDDESDEEDSPHDLSGSFLQQKGKQGKTPKKEVKIEKTDSTPKKTVVKTEKANATPKASLTPKAWKTPKLSATEKVKGTPKQTPQKDTPKQKQKAVESPATPDTEGKKKKKKKKKQQDSAQASPETKPSANGATPNTEGKKKKQKQNQENKTAEEPKKAKKVVAAGGTTIEDVKEGHGPEAKSGKMVHVYYKGMLKDGTVFDAVTSGKPFKFRLGRQEVIRGWDTGVQGMKVGSKRKLTVPASQAYGSQRVGKIPAGSTLQFEVELKAVS